MLARACRSNRPSAGFAGAIRCSGRHRKGGALRVFRAPISAWARPSPSPRPSWTVAEDRDGDPDLVDEHFDTLRTPPILLAVRGALVTTRATQLDYFHGRHATTGMVAPYPASPPTAMSGRPVRLRATSPRPELSGHDVTLLREVRPRDWLDLEVRPWPVRGARSPSRRGECDVRVMRPFRFGVNMWSGGRGPHGRTTRARSRASVTRC